MIKELTDLDQLANVASLITPNLLDEVAELGPDFQMPDNLSVKGAAAYVAIVRQLIEMGLTEANGRVFYSPKEWHRERGENYGLGSELVICHDGPIGRAFSYDQEDYKSIDKMVAALDPLELYTEQGTSWYSAVFPS